jgi:hypothetical protein
MRLMNRRSRNGQGIIIVAFAFIALIAFVGITVDVALLFVRYSALRRAVDAAAIAAAGQIREGTDYATLQSVAASFVGLQGSVDPKTVIVDTCETEVDDAIKGRIPGAPSFTGFPPNERSAKALDWLVDVKKPPSEICRKPPQKLVRVSAQLDSPTTFLRLLGWPTVKLEASSVSQTAVLDVALVLDTSLSNGYGTYNAQNAKKSDGTRVYPKVTENLGGSYNFPTNKEALKDFKEFREPLKSEGGADTLQPYSEITTGTPNNTGKNATGQPAIRYECWKDDTGYLQVSGYNSNYAWGGCCNDPTTQGNPGTNSEPVVPMDADSNPLKDAQGLPVNNLAFSSPNYDINWFIYDAPGLKEAKINAGNDNPKVPGGGARVLSGKPDNNYSDLLCRPFKDVRDAARRFIKRLDFVRGDRLMLVTFSADVNVITPEGGTVPVIVNKDNAIRTLNEKVGITVNATGYQGNYCVSGKHPGFRPNEYQLAGRFGYGTTEPGDVKEERDMPYRNWRDLASYWTIAQCTDTNMGGGIRAGRAVLTNPDWIRRESVWVMVVFSDGFPNRTPPYDATVEEGTESLNIGGVPDRPGLTLSDDDFVMAPGKTISDYCASPFAPDPDDPDPSDTYLGWRFLNATQMETLGTKPHLCTRPLWDPAVVPNDPYYKEDWEWTNPNKLDRVKSFGFCPAYTYCNLNPATGSLQTNPPAPECSIVDESPRWTASESFKEAYGSGGNWSAGNSSNINPFCADNNPESRHFCYDNLGRINYGVCDEFYDADDYTRDQADAAGLLQYTKDTKGAFINMFAIFFQPNPDDVLDTNDALDEKILGVSVMRYIADAGDNGVIDDRLQRWYREAYQGTLPSGSYPPVPVSPDPKPFNTLMSLSITDPAGLTSNVVPSDRQIIIPGVVTDPVNEPFNDPCTEFKITNNGYLNSDGSHLAPTDRSKVGNGTADSGASPDWLARQDCGNFFFASSITKVNDAFAGIASRLFTRLSR